MQVKKWEKLADLHIAKRPFNQTAVFFSGLDKPDDPPLHEYFSDHNDDNVEFNNEGWCLVEAPGIREAARSELYYLRLKASLAIAATKSLLANGNEKWATVDAYHAGLMCMRVVLGTFGIFQSGIGENKQAIIDVFHKFADPRIVRETESAASNFSYPCKLISRREKTISHTTLTALFRRLMAVNYNFICSEQNVQKALRLIDPEKYHPVRNKVIYVGGFLPEISTTELPTAGNRRWLEDDDRDLSLVSNMIVSEPIENIL